MRHIAFVCSLVCVAAMNLWGQATITTFATVNPHPAIVGVPSNFSVAATSSTGSPVTITWTFGDGATQSGANVSYAYPATGVFNVVVVAYDGSGTHVANFIPLAVVDSGPYALIGYSKGKGKNAVLKTGTDSLSLSGVILNAAADSSSAGKTVTFNFGGNAMTFNLNKSGAGKSSDGNASLSFKYPKNFAGGKVTFTLSMKKQTLFPIFENSGYRPTAAFRVNQVGVDTAIFYGSTQYVGKVFINIERPKAKGKARKSPRDEDDEDDDDDDDDDSDETDNETVSRDDDSPED